MPLFIGDNPTPISLSAAEINKLIADLLKLPIPELYNFSDEPITAENTVVSHQREIVRVKHSLGNKVRYVGTKKLLSCIFVCLTDSSETLTIHCDKMPNPDLIESIKTFAGDEIRVSLFGGVPGDSEYSSNSKAALTDCLTKLHAAALKFNKKIVIQKQLLLQHNQTNENDVLHFAFYELRQKIKLFYFELYDENLSDDFFQNKTLTPLVSVVKSNFNKKTLQTFAMVLAYFKKFFRPEEYEEFMSYYKLLAQSSDLSLDNKVDYTGNGTVAIKFVPFAAKKIFLELVDYMYTFEGFDQFKDALIPSDTPIPGTKLYSFVFDCKTEALIRVNPYMQLSFDEFRNIAIIDGCKSNLYHTYYDDRRPQKELLPKLSPDIIKVLSIFNKAFDFKNLVLTHEFLKKFNKIFKVSERQRKYDSQYIYNFLAWSISNPRNFPPKEDEIKSSSFSPLGKCPPLGKSQVWYLSKEIKSTTTSSEKLEKMTGHTFVLKYRHFPETTVDALLPLESEAKLEEIASILSLEKIGCKMVEFSDLGKCLCVEAINHRVNAKKIEAAQIPAPLRKKLRNGS